MKKMVMGVLATLSLLSCEKEPEPDPCDGITCYNDGVCVNGACDCPPEYTGPSCDKQVTPSIIRIHSINISKFAPTKDNGAGWDASSGPDIYPVLRDKDNNTIYYSSETLWDATNGNSMKFPVSPSLELAGADVQKRYILLWADDDMGDVEYMNAFEIGLYSSTRGFPETLTYQSKDGQWVFSIEVSYAFP